MDECSLNEVSKVCVKNLFVIWMMTLVFCTFLVVSIVHVLGIINELSTGSGPRGQCLDSDYSTPQDDYVTWCDLNNTLRAQLRQKFMQTSGSEPFFRLIGQIVRLEFHDCMGPKEYDMDGSQGSICDGMHTKLRIHR